MKRHPNRSPNIPKFVQMLSELDVRFVVTGSVAAQLYGVDLEPGDFDITPALDQDNLQRLVQLLLKTEATPKSFGHWDKQSNWERKWIDENATPGKLASWSPDPENISTLDHLFLTRYGNFDIVPELVGKYEDLMLRAVQKNTFGYEVWVAHIDELLARLTIPRRKKDVQRVGRLREIQRSQQI